MASAGPKATVHEGGPPWFAPANKLGPRARVPEPSPASPKFHSSYRIFIGQEFASNFSCCQPQRIAHRMPLSVRQTPKLTLLHPSYKMSVMSVAGSAGVWVDARAICNNALPTEVALWVIVAPLKPSENARAGSSRAQTICKATLSQALSMATSLRSYSNMAGLVRSSCAHAMLVMKDFEEGMTLGSTVPPQCARWQAPARPLDGCLHEACH